MTQQVPDSNGRTDIEHMTRLCDTLSTPGSAVPHGADIELADALLRRDFDTMKLVTAAWHLLLSNSQVRTFLECAWKGDTISLDRVLADGTLIALYNTPLMQALLKTTPVPDLHFERLTAHVRMRLLECTADPSWQPDPSTVKAAAGIGVHAFLTEYICRETEQEAQLVEALRARISHQAGQSLTSFDVAILSAYRPLHEMLDRASMLAQADDDMLSDLFRVQVDEPAHEQVLASQIPTVTPIEDSISAAVQEQYEEHPYPRWVAAMHNDPVTPVELFASACRGVDVGAFGARESHSLLFAGCGTGKIVAEERVLWQTAEALAFDLSKTSLAYAYRRTLEMGLDGVEFAQGDLLELPSLGRSFDYISCGGVLHHMADPIAGWRALSEVCRPGGVMRICLYSELARAPVRYAQLVIGDLRDGADAAAIKVIRQALVERIVSPDSSDARLQEIFTAMDMYTTSMCRDLLFHVHEQDFTIPRLASAIEQLGLKFCGFVDPEGKLLKAYQAFAPEDPDGLDLMSWHRFELEHPATFAQMYDVMVQKPL